MAADPAEVERAWFREHPDPLESGFGDRLSLWNYAIGRADLAVAHQAAIHDFLGVGPLGPAHPAAELNVRGHASASGSAAENATLSAARAKLVAAYISTLGVKRVDPSSAGSSEPEDPSPFGGAYARNRRVDVWRFYPPVTEGTTPIPAPQPTPPEPQAPPVAAEPGLISSSGFEINGLNLKLTESKTSAVTWAVFFELNGKGTLKGPRGGVEEALALKSGDLTAKFAAPLGEHLKLRLQGTPGAGGKPGSMGAGLQWTGLNPLPGTGSEGKAEIGFQFKPNFFYVSGSLGQTVLGPVEILEGVTVVADVEVKLKIEAGLSSEFISTLMRQGPVVARGVLTALEEGAAAFLNRLAGGVAEEAGAGAAVEALLARLGAGLLPAAAAVGWFAAGATLAAGFSAGFAAIVNGCVAEAEAFTYVMARRSGAAGRLAVEIFAGDDVTAIAHKQRGADYLRLAGGSASQQAFRAGEALMDAQIAALKQSGALDDRRRQWAEAYAKGANAGDYDAVGATVFRQLGGLETAPRDLEADVKQL